MKLLGQLLIALSLVIGVLSAATAYLAPLSLPDSAFMVRSTDEEKPATLSSPVDKPIDDAGKTQPIAAAKSPATLSSPAGKRIDDAGKAQPIAAAKSPTTPEVLAALRQAGVKYVKLKEFSLQRWPGKWWFAGAVLGLAIGAVLVRAATRRQVMAAAERAGGGAAGSVTPASSLAAIRATLQDVTSSLGGIPEAPARLSMISQRLGEAQQTHIETFLAGRPILIGTLGIGGFAMLMDRFAAGERQLNRAWSAAVDGYEEEAVACLKAADELFAQAETRLQR